MKLPNALSLLLLGILYFTLNWILTNIAQFGIPVEYIQIVSGILAASATFVAKLISERNQSGALSMTSRGLESEPAQDSYWTRVVRG